MSRAKLINECIKQMRAGMTLDLKAGVTVPNSAADKNAVGRFYTRDGGCHIARTSRDAPTADSSRAGNLPDAPTTR